MSIQLLAPELLERIVHFTHPSSWKALRLTNSTFESIASTFLFKEVDVWIQTDSLKRLISIATSRFSLNVRTLNIHNGYMSPELLSPQSFINAICLGKFFVTRTSSGLEWCKPDEIDSVIIENFTTIPEKLVAEGWTDEKLFTAWKFQKDLAREQEELIQSDVDVEYFAQALQHLPKLSAINFPRLGQRSAFGFGGVYSGGETTRADGRQLLSFLRALSRINDPLHTPAITSLIVDEYFWEQGANIHSSRSESNYADFGTAEIKSAFKFLQQLRTLELPCNQQPYFSRRDQREKRKNDIAVILQSTPILEHLTLYNNWRYSSLRLQQPFSTMTSTTLLSLKLQNCSLDLAQMEAFFQTHAHTLKRIHLENIALIGGNYVDFFASLLEKLNSPPQDVSIKGWLIEVQNEDAFYSIEEEIDVELYYVKTELRRRARREIEAFLRGERDYFPSWVLDMDEVVAEDGINVLIGVSNFFGDSEELEW